MRRALRAALSALALVAGAALAAGFDYQLAPHPIGPDTWLVEGHTEDFSFANGGNIVNTAFVVTGAGVLVIDTGPSRQYGEQLRAAIARITDEPIVAVINTHHHPDHFLGNQAFAADALQALPETIALIGEDGPGFNDNMYRLAGDAMAGTEVTTPGHGLVLGPLQLGRHRFELLALAGHTPRDLALFDRSTGILFASDLVFHNRAPTTPHADIGDWLAALDVLAALPATRVVPGHGPVSDDGAALAQTRRWLHWLSATLRAGAERGLDMNEVLATPIPADLAALPLARAEFTRSVAHLYPAMELSALEHARTEEPRP